MANQNSNLTIGQLFELNQGKNATQIADSEAQYRNAAKTLGLDYKKLTAPPAEVKRAADEVNRDKAVQDVINSDPVVGGFINDPNNATIALDDLNSLTGISNSISSITPNIVDPKQALSDDELHNIVSKGTSKEQKKKLQQLNIYQPPVKKIEPKVPSVLSQMLNQPAFEKPINQVIDEQEKDIFNKYGSFRAAQYRNEMEKQLFWQNEFSNQLLPSLDTNETNSPNIDAIKRGYATLWQTAGAVNYALTGNSDILQRFTNYKNQLPQSDELQNTLQSMSNAAQYSEYGVLSATAEFLRKADLGITSEFLLEQLPPSLAGFAVGYGASAPLANTLTRSTAKILPYVVNADRAIKTAGFIGAATQGAIGSGFADAFASYGPNMAEAREKFLTRAEQVDYAAAKTWGSAKYSALGGVLLPAQFGGALRTVGGQAVIQSAAGMASVYGGAHAVGEKADPVEVALEGLFGGIMALPEVAVVTAGKVKNTHTATIAFEQARQDQENDAARSVTFASLLSTLVDRFKSSKTTERDSDTSRAFVQQAVAEHGAVSEVYIDGETFNQLLRDNDIDPEDLFARAPSLQDQLGDAEEFSGSLQIPLDEFVASMSALDDPLPFIENTRANPDLPTLRESQENLNKTREQMQQEADTFLEEQAKFENAEAASDSVNDTIFNQLVETKQFNNKYNRSAAELATAFYSTLGEKLGIDAKTAFERYPIRITGDTGVDASYSQSASAMKSVEANIKRGQDNLTKALTDKADVKRAMYRQGMGWVDFVYGSEGLVKPSGKTKSAMGLSHIIESRMRKDGLSESESIQLLQSIVETIARGSEIRRFKRNGTTQAVLALKDIEAVLVKSKGSNTWLLSGWERRPDANVAANDTHDATHSKADSSDLEVGAGSSILDQFSNSYKQNGTRGSITFQTDQDGSTIVLSKNADFSTFVHELGHHFLEMNMQLALDPDAPIEIKQDMETVLKWADPKIDDLGEWDFLSSDEKTEIHEKFAESFEQYVFTGKAPSIPLKQVFSRFRQFMIAVYRNIEKFIGINSRAELNPDLTGVMDRMLASTSAIAEAEAASRLEMLISQDDAMRLGISPKDYDEMRQEHEDATEFATNTLEQRSIRDLVWYQKQRSKYLKTLQREANKKRAAVREEIAKEVMQEPVYRVMQFLRQPNDVQEKTNHNVLNPERDNLFTAIAKLGGLDAAEVESAWGIDEAAKIKSGVGNKPLARSERSKQKGLSIEHMAERLAEEGYLSVDEHGKFDTRELENKFAEELSGVKQYSTRADAELILYAQDMDLLQQFNEGQLAKAKLSLDWIESKYGKDSPIYLAVSKGRYGLAMRGGESPDLIAEMFDYESGDAMIRDLISAPTPKQRIDELTDERMAVQYAEFFDDQSITEAVESALHNDIRARFLATEMAALNNMMGRRSALNEAAKAIAQDMINRQEIKNIRPHLRAQDDARLGRQSMDAFKKGNTVEAARLKRNQLVQFYATKYSYDAKDQIQKQLNLVKKVFGNNDQLAKNRDFDMVTAARGILGKYGLGRESTNYQQQLELIRKYDPTTYADIQNIGVLPENQDYRQLTSDQFNAVMAAVETLWHRSRENKLWHLTNESIEREQVREDLIQQSSGKKNVDKVDQKLIGRNKAVELKVKFMEFAASAKRVDQVITWLDGGMTGKYRQYILNPMQDALATYRIDKAKMLEKITDIFSGFGNIDNAKIDAPELNGYTFNGKQALIHAVLHTGNLSNKERLVLGYGWGNRLEDGSVDFYAWDKFFNRMIAEGVITKNDMDTVQKLWDLFDSYKEKAQITHKKINGRYFDELPSLTLSTLLGDYRGGYVPATYDRIRSNEQDRIQDKNEAENNLQAMDIATTGANFTKSRADRYHDQLELDLSKLPSALDKELRYIHLEPQIRQVGRLMLNKDFRNELERVLPYSVKQVFNPWLKTIANQSVDESSGLQLADNVFRALRRNTGIAIMAGNLKNAVEQLTGFTQVTVAVPVKDLLKAQGHFFASVATRKSMAEDIMNMSDFMRTRWDRAADEYRYAVDEIVFDKNKYQTVRDFTMKHAYILQTTIQRPMEVISWQAAFNHYTEQGMNQYDAIHAADAVIRQYMNDMSPEGISNLERGTPAKRMFLMFYNWFNMVWNTASTEVKLAMEQNNGSWVKASPRLAYIALMMISIPAIVSELLTVMFAGGVKDSDDDDNKWDDLSARLALSQVKMLAAFVPYAGNVLNSAISNTDSNVMNDRYTASPVFSMGESSLALIQHANRALDDDKDVNQGRFARDALNTATFATGIPFAMLGKPSNYWLQIQQGKQDEPDSITDAVRGTITGKHAPSE
ncbi:GNAT family N-acetyltransferase [Acinetobacter puyangensis]|uniref:putative barnase/colicin E5 family endoribonuclease n=1 Tax=Acinetobacter puyangensis TaxID=1096779 RepID=UPI003A4E22CD